jgi:anti-sigma-K factor RskA
MDDSQRFDLIPAYALGVLDNEERMAVEHLLARSEAARQLLREYQTVADGLALTVVPRKAPMDLTEKFMAQLAQRPDPVADHPVDTSRQPAKITVLNTEYTSVRPWRRIAHWPIIAAAAILVAIFLTSISVSRVLAPGPLTAVDPTSAQAALIQSILANPTGKLTSFVVSDTQSASMIVTIYSIPGEPTAVLDNSNMPTLASGQQYELWAIATNQSPLNVEVFDGVQAPISTPTTLSKLNSKVLVSFPKPLTNYNVLAITVEPHGGSAAPTSKPILTLSIAP